MPVSQILFLLNVYKQQIISLEIIENETNSIQFKMKNENKQMIKQCRQFGLMIDSS